MTLTATARGSGNHNTGASSFTLSPGSNCTAGALVAICVAADNSGGSGGDTNDFTTVTDSIGNTWTKRQSPVYDPAGASAGVQGAIFTTAQNVSALQTGTVITVAFTSSPVAKTWTLTEIASSQGTPPTFRTGGNKAAGAAATALTSGASGSVSVGECILAAFFMEAGTTQSISAQDTDGTNGAWATAAYNEIGTTTAGSAIASSTKVQTTTPSTQTFDITVAVSSDYHSSWIIVQENSASGSSAGTSTASAVGSSTAVSSGSAAGSSTAAGVKGTVPTDATSSHKLPESADNWTLLLGGSGLSNPTNTWLWQAASTPIPDTMGSAPMDQNIGTVLYQQTVSGLTRKGVKASSDGAAEYFTNNSGTGIPNVSSTSVLLLEVRRLANVSAARALNNIGLDAFAGATVIPGGSGPKLRAAYQGANTDGTIEYTSPLVVIVTKLDYSRSEFAVYTSQGEKITGTWSGAMPNGGGATYLVQLCESAAASVSPIAYSALFTGAAAELSDAQVQTLIGLVDPSASTPATSGSSAGTSTASAVGSSTAVSSGSDAGTSTASGVGSSTAATSGSVAGTSAASATGSSTAAASGSAAGSASVSATGQSTAAASGSSAGTTTATAAGSSTAVTSGSVAGTSTAAGVGERTATASGSAAGTSSASAEGGEIREASGSATGSATASGVGASTAAAAGSAAGTATVTSAGGSVAEASGSSAGSAAASAAGSSTAAASGSAAATSAASGAGSSVAEASGSSAGSATALAIAAGFSIGIAAGSSTATAVGLAIAVADGSSVGSSAASAAGETIAWGTGTAAGLSTASAEGSSVAEASGSANGIATAASDNETEIEPPSTSPNTGTGPGSSITVQPGPGSSLGISRFRGSIVVRPGPGSG